MMIVKLLQQLQAVQYTIERVDKQSVKIKIFDYLYFVCNNYKFLNCPQVDNRMATNYLGKSLIQNIASVLTCILGCVLLQTYLTL